MRISTLHLAPLVLALALPAAGSARVRVEPHERSDTDKNLLGMPVEDVNVGVGYGNWTGDVANDLSAGVAWNVAADLDVTRPVDLELNYVGGVNSFAPTELNEFNLYTNGVQAAVQVEPWDINDRLTPYASGGLGLSRLSVARNPDLSPEFQSDTLGTVPIALGADYDIGRSFTLGARAQYDFTFDNELVTTQDKTSSDRSSFMVRLGSSGF
jgi:hypothetical protein